MCTHVHMHVWAPTCITELLSHLYTAGSRPTAGEAAHTFSKLRTENNGDV